MTSNSARKRTIRSIAASEGISYTEAMRRYEQLEALRDAVPNYLANLPAEVHARAQAIIDSAEGPEQRAYYENLFAVLQASRATEGPADAQRAATAELAFLNRLFETRKPTPAAPLSGNTWRIHFRLNEDMSKPLDLYVTDGGLINQQYFWRGEKFQIMGFTGLDVEPGPYGMDLPWHYIESGERPLSDAVGLVPVISDMDGTWSTWREEIDEVTFSVDPDRAAAKGKAVSAIFLGSTDPVVDDTNPPRFEFRAEEFLLGLTDADLRALAADDWIADARISGLLFRAAVARGDAQAVAAADWVEAQYERDPEAWDHDEPFRVDFDEEQVRALMSDRIYPSHR